jgi:hypothetical protein
LNIYVTKMYGTMNIRYKDHLDFSPFHRAEWGEKECTVMQFTSKRF